MNDYSVDGFAWFLLFIYSDAKSFCLAILDRNFEGDFEYN
jgi:hypothetical protein